MCNVIIIGASGHGKVIADIVLKSGDKVSGFLDDDDNLPKEIIGFPLLGKVSDIQNYKFNKLFVIGIGSNQTRKKFAESLFGINWYTAIHPSAQISIDTEIGKGTVIMANAVINTSAKIGKHCIINTGAIVEHDNVLEDYVHISPNVALGGTVKVGELSHIGIGSSVKDNIIISPNCIIGAGAVVVKNINVSGTYIGVPARRMG